MRSASRRDWPSPQAPPTAIWPDTEPSKNGAEDAKLGLAVWPLSYKDRLAFGVNGNLILPTGFRENESYYDSTTNSVIELPAYSLKQTGGQLSLGGAWAPGKAAELSAFFGYFGTSDNTEQALRWGMGLSLTPFGERIGASVAYGQSITRVGNLPDTEVLHGGLDLKLPWGFGLHPGVYAELEDDPLIGGSIGLSFEGRLPRSVFPPKAQPAAAPYRTGSLLVAPPITSMPMADNDELWYQLRESMKQSFDLVMPLPSLDRPGLPFDAMNREAFWNSMSAIHAAYPTMRWMLVTYVDDETVVRGTSLSIPLIVSKPKIEAACKLRVQLVDLVEQKAYVERTVMATAILNDGLRSPFLSTIESEKVTVTQAREVTKKVYRNAGREVALTLPPRGADE